LSDDCRFVSEFGRRRLQSSDVWSLALRRVSVRASQLAGPKLWNILLASLRQSDITIRELKTLLKTHLFA